MQYICAFTEIELEVIFWQQGIGSVLLPEKNHHPAKKVPTSNTIGNIYEIIPNKPKKKRLTVPPIVPPNPKLLINSKSETATTIHKITSRVNSASRSCCFFVFLLCPEFVFLPDDDFFCRFEPGKPGGSRKISGGHFVCGIFMFVF